MLGKRKRSKMCEEEGCNKIPVFNNPDETKGKYCTSHKKYGMINVKHKKCEAEGCDKIPNFNDSGKKSGKYCINHKKYEMIDVINKKCEHEGCTTLPIYNEEGQIKGKYCVLHKLNRMIDVKNKKCAEDACKTRPSFNYRGNPKGQFCGNHQKEGMIDVVSKRCSQKECETIPHNNKYKGFCFFCYRHLFPTEPVSRNWKTKEGSICDFIKLYFSQYDWSYDKIIRGGCSKRRPDFLLDLGYQCIIIEVDENQHELYDETCENRRTMEISQDLGHRPLIFIRFNPDGYRLDNGFQVSSCWRENKHGILVIQKSKQKEWENRLQQLKQTIEYWLEPHNRIDKCIHVVSLFFDNYNKDESINVT